MQNAQIIPLNTISMKALALDEDADCLTILKFVHKQTVNSGV
jgi:hypothetical protein